MEVAGVDLPLADFLSARSRPGRTPSRPSLGARPIAFLIESEGNRGVLPFNSRHLPNEKTPFREFFLRWRWRELNPRPRARTASVYRFIRPFDLSERGQRIGAPSLPYPGCSPQVPSGRNLSEPSVSVERYGRSRPAQPRTRRLRYLRSESEIAVIVGN